MNILYNYVHLVRTDHFNNRKLNIDLEEIICRALFSIMEKRQNTDSFRPPMSNISRSAPDLNSSKTEAATLSVRGLYPEKLREGSPTIVLTP